MLQSTLKTRDELIDVLKRQVATNEMTEMSLKQSQLQCQGLLSEVSSLQGYLSTTEEKLYKTNVTTLDLLRQLKQAEEECESLKAYIVDLKLRLQIYHPVREDETDVAVADFINNYPDRKRLKVLFQREAQGIYVFGTCKVNVSLQKGKLFVRVGGGYISVDEFVDQYTAQEVERLKRGEPQASKR